MSPRVPALGAALLALGLLAALPAGAAEPDPRVVQANARLGDPETWPEAIRLYREVLEEEPARHDVRIRLARVLAWSEQHEEALAAYDRVLEAQPDHPEAPVERAEVLSWEGRYDEAEAAFTSLLEADPRNARAARGLARTHAWSGRILSADAAYERALALEDDPELRAERRRLAGERPDVGLRSDWLEDSEQYTRRESFLEGSLPLGLRTRLFGHVGIIAIRQTDFGEFGSSPHEGDRAIDAALGLERRFTDALKAAFTLGARSWRHAPDRPYLRGRLEYSPSSRTWLQLAVSHEDHLDRAQSRSSTAENVRGTYASLGLWRQLTPGVETFAQAQLGWLNDGNRMRSGYAELTVRPFAALETRVVWDGNLLSYSHREDAYYSPNLSVSSGLGLRHRFRLHAVLALELGARGGWGYAREAVLRADGPEWGGHAALEWSPGAWRVRLEARYGQTQRSIAYDTARVGLQLVREF